MNMAYKFEKKKYILIVDKNHQSFYYLEIVLLFFTNICIFLPWHCFLVLRMLACTLKVCGFNSQSRPQTWVAGSLPSLIGACVEDNQSVCVSHINASLLPLH